MMGARGGVHDENLKVIISLLVQYYGLIYIYIYICVCMQNKWWDGHGMEIVLSLLVSSDHCGAPTISFLAASTNGDSRLATA